MPPFALSLLDMCFTFSMTSDSDAGAIRYISLLLILILIFWQAWWKAKLSLSYGIMSIHIQPNYIYLVSLYMIYYDLRVIWWWFDLRMIWQPRVTTTLKQILFSVYYIFMFQKIFWNSIGTTFMVLYRKYKSRLYTIIKLCKQFTNLQLLLCLFYFTGFFSCHIANDLTTRWNVI